MTESKEKVPFAPEEREKHKKEQRVHGSLGSILSGLAASGGGDSNGSRAGPTNGGNNSYSGQQERKSSFPPSNAPAMGRNQISSKLDFGWTPAGFQGAASSSSTLQNQEESYKKPRVDDPIPKRPRMDDPIPEELDCWAEVKKFDDDFDPVWVSHEHKKLDDLFGEGIVTVKYTEHGTLGYYCELCLSSMNAMKPLEMHCSGMKHLKKKDLYEKSKASGDKTIGVRNRSPPRLSGLRSRGKYEPPAKQSRGRGYNRDRFSRDDRRSRDDRPPRDARHPRDDPYARDDRPPRDERPPRDDPYARDSLPGAQGYDRDPYRSERDLPGAQGYDTDPYRSERDYRDYEKEPYGRGRDRHESPGPAPYADRYRDNYRDQRPEDMPYSGDRQPPGDLLYSGDRQPPGDLLYSGDRQPPGDLLYSGDRQHPGDLLYSGDRQHPGDQPYSGDHQRPGDRPYSGDRLNTFDRPPTIDYDHSRSQPREVPLRMPTPPPIKVPMPVEDNLSNGPAAALLMKLARCTVKNEEDSDLASNVINLLLKSLKEYNLKLGEKSVSDLMEQAEIKLGTAKAIRSIRKPTLASNDAMTAISLAMDTLRRANPARPLL